MISKIKKTIKGLIQKMGYDIVRSSTVDMEKEFKEIYEKCKDYTMTPEERMYALYKAIKYLVDAKIEGDIVECGVWKGGSSMLGALTLLKSNDTKRKIFLYDTYAGMTKPTDKDKPVRGGLRAIEKWNRLREKDYNEWWYVSLEEVKENMFSTGYPREKLIFVKGKVEDTLPETIPTRISLLRLDTDWYGSTYHELNHLFPRLSEGGVIIIDDYGYWQGAKEAVDRYFKENSIKILLNRIDHSGRIGIKLNK